MVINNMERVELKNKTKPSSSNLTEKQLDKLDKRREQYLLGEGKTYSWKQVKQDIFCLSVKR